MKKNKILSFILLSSFFFVVSVEAKIDFGQDRLISSETQQAIDVLVSKNIIMYQEDAIKYRITRGLSRWEAAKMLFWFYNAFNKAPLDAYNCRGGVFADISGSPPFCSYIESLADNHIINTTNSNFYPDKIMTRAEMITFLFRVIGFKPIDKNPGVIDVSYQNCWEHTGYIYNAISLGLIKKQVTFRPNDSATRGEFMLLLARILNGGAR